MEGQGCVSNFCISGSVDTIGESGRLEVGAHAVRLVGERAPPAQVGGGVFISHNAMNTFATFVNCHIHDNVARTVSAGIGMQRRNKATFTNCNIYNNEEY